MSAIAQAVILVVLGFSVAVFVLVKLSYMALDWLANKVTKALRD